MKLMRSIFLLVILSTMLVPGTIEGLGLSAILRLVRLSPSWLTVTLGHLLWTLPFAIVVSLVGLSAVRPSTVAAARDLGAGPMRAFLDVTLPLIRGNLVSSFVFAFLLSLNEYARAYYLVGRQNTLPLYMFDAMNSGASPTIYAFSGAVLVVSFAAVALIFVIAARRQSGPPGVSLAISQRAKITQGCLFAEMGRKAGPATSSRPAMTPPRPSFPRTTSRPDDVQRDDAQRDGAPDSSRTLHCRSSDRVEIRER
jgi:ABC-type molybdate transport system permease subunit